MPKRDEDIYGTHKFLNQPQISRALMLAVKKTNRELKTSATLQQVKCALSRGLIQRSKDRSPDKEREFESVKDSLDTITRSNDLCMVFGWYTVTVPWDKEHTNWWCTLSHNLYHYRVIHWHLCNTGRPY